MKEQKSPSTSILIIQDPKAASILTNPASLRQLEPFLARDCSISQAAKETGVKANTVLSRVRRLLDLGLLKVSRVLARKGRSIKLYRSSSEMFFVPYEATSADTLETALAEREAYWETQLRKNVVRARMEDIGSWGTRIYRDKRGRLQVQTAVTPERNYSALDADGPAVLSAWRDSLYLDFEDAKTLQREMFSLLKSYQQKRGSQHYIVHLGIAPLLKQDN